jgi:Zn-dependent protease/predicted transcriptional regulator
MRGSLFLGRVFGIKVLMHFTFLLLFVYIAYIGYRQHLSVNDIIFQCGLTLAVFGCVLIHEFGHALMARRLGISTKQILILPIGGVAQLEKMPENPKQELMVTFAGPAMNIVIASIIFPFVAFRFNFHQLINPNVITDHFFLSLMWINLMLFVFNLVPAYPMDGGRVLRALLAFRINYISSTRIAARLGQLFALGIIASGIYIEHYIWIALGLFVGIAAELELRMVVRKYKFKGHMIADIIDQEFHPVSPLLTLNQVEDIIRQTGRKSFIVMDEQMVAGVINEEMIQRAEQEYESSVLVGTVMKTDFPRLKAEMPAELVFTFMQDHNVDILPVLRGAECIGVVTLEKLTALMNAGPLRQFALHTKSQFNMGLSGEFESTL